ncbi:AT-rich interactive domain-containing protein 2 isoform X2 [Anabrus simplex]|uniref:AT-rich interactive domain-containing protein 2 isoform X2 n=1 Tax=Anabrus simplex TaxID=316456 RepID=UPI0035A2C88F
MAKILNKDPVAYQRERDGFIRDLRQFHETRGTPFRKVPKINGHEIDLYLLYVLVTAHGGWVKVNSRNEWETLVDHFRLTKHCVNSGVALKQIYLRYLDRYEKLHYLGEDVDRASDDDEESRHRRWSARALHSVPLTYNHHQHNVAENLRSYNGLSADLYKASDYDRLALSLLSPLPNEQDFAINVCTLLSNEGKHTLRLDKCPRLVDFLLAHAGVFNHPTLRPLFDEVYSNMRKHSLRQFWLDTVVDSDISELAFETKFVKHNTKELPDLLSLSSVNESVDVENNISVGSVVEAMDVDVVEEEISEPQDEEGQQNQSRLKFEESDRDLFCLGRTLGTQDYFGQRVLQIATILRNLSFSEENVTVLARNSCFLRFLLLCAGSRWNCLHQLGLDMLGNVASEVLVEDPLADRLAAGLVATVTRGLASQDRMVVVSCLEILNKLSQKDENEDVMLRYLDQKVYDQVCSYLTLHDIMLLIYTLECLYSLSSLGERACNCIVRVHGAIDTLVSLITVEAQSYGPKACILMRVVETVSGTPSGCTTTTTTTTTTSAMSSLPAPSTSSPLPTPPRPTTPATPQRQITPQRMLVGVPQPAVATPVSLPSAMPHHPPQQQQQQQQQQQHANQQAAQENEQFALAWLRATFEPTAGCRVEQGEMYKLYLTACAKVGRRGVIAPLHFPRCVRSVFGGSIGPSTQKAVIVGGTGGDQPVTNLSFYEGIKVRTTPYPITVMAPVQQPVVRKALHMVAKTVTPPPCSSTPPPPPVPTTAATVITAAVTTTTPATEPLAADVSVPVVPAPCSPILKAQLSAPPKPRETTKGDPKSQVLAHPHLSQALLGSGGGGGQTPKEGAATGPSSTSLIKSLLATKVMPGAAECMGMQPAPAVCASDNQPPPQQVTQRQQQQRLLQQQLQTQSPPPPSQKDCTSPPPLVQSSTPSKVQPTQSGTPTAVIVKSKIVTAKPPDPRQRLSRINGARAPLQLQSQVDGKDVLVDSSVSEMPTPVSTPITRVVENHLPVTGGGNSALRGRREPPQPPPPPLAPLSSGPGSGNPVQSRLPRLDVEDSDSTGNNSLASSSGIGGSRDCSGIGTGNISSTDDNENSLTSFEGILLNGIPHSLDIDAASNDSSSKDSAQSASLVKPPSSKSLMLADLLEKKVDKKEPPILNGVLGKELRIGEKGLELVENHLEKVLKDSVVINPHSKILEVKDVGIVVGSDGVVRTVGQTVVNVPGALEQEKETIAFKTVGTVTDDSLSADQLKLVVTQQTQTIQAVKRPAEAELTEEGLIEAKRMHFSETAVNGTISPGPNNVSNNPEQTTSESVISSVNMEGNTASDDTENLNTSSSSSTSGNYPSAANLYAAIAASALEDEPEEEPPPPVASGIQLVGGGLRQTVFLGPGVETSPQQQLIVTAAPRQIIVSQGQLASQSQVLITAGGQITLQQGPNTPAATATIKTPAGHQAVPVLVQTGGATAQRTQLATVQAGQVMLSQSSSGQFILSQAPQGQVQLVTSGGQGGQYIVSSGGAGQTHYVVAQPQTALVQGQTQTVLVAQTPQQQGTSAKTIIILQPQSSATATHHQKVVVTPQGQPVVVTQVPRPILQSPAITNVTPVISPPALIPSTSTPATNSSSVSPTKSISGIASPPNPVSSLPARPMQPTHNVSNPAPSLPPAQQPRAVTPNSIPVAVVTSVVSMKSTKPIITTTSPPVHNPPPSSSPRPSTPQNSPISSPNMRPMTTVQQKPNRQLVSIRGTPTSETVEKISSPSQPVLRSAKNALHVSSPSNQSTQQQRVDQAHFLCEWRGCMRSFKSANEVYMHACESHCPLGSEEIQCLWERCDAMKRKRFSLMTHLYDRHCNADVLRMMAVRRRQLSQSGRSEIPPPQPPPPHPGYAPNAAFHAIKRHALEFVNPKEMMDDNEGPVTKSIRLTSSLILRNLVIYSTNGRRFLRSYEPHLASVALSNVESSRTIAQVLYDMNHQSSQR